MNMNLFMYMLNMVNMKAKLSKVYAGNIVDKWIDYFVLHKNIKFERINNKLIN